MLLTINDLENIHNILTPNTDFFNKESKIINFINFSLFSDVKIQGQWSEIFRRVKNNHNSYNYYHSNTLNKVYDKNKESIPHIDLLNYFEQRNIVKIDKHILNGLKQNELNKVFDYLISKDADIIKKIHLTILNNSTIVSDHKLLIENSKFLLNNYILGNETSNYMNEELFTKIADKISYATNQSHHSIVIKFLTAGVEGNYNQDTILKNLKIFLERNPVLNQVSLGFLDKLKDLIKDWDLSRHFTKAEVKSLYREEAGYLAKEIEGFYYNIDASVLEKKKKISSYVCLSNIKNFLNHIPDILAQDDKFVSINQNIVGVKIDINISFERGVAPSKIEALNTVMEAIVFNNERLSEQYVREMLKSSLLKVFLENTLYHEEEKVKPKKLGKI